MSTTTERAKEIKEGQMISLLRNALLVAGTEMGEEGDHWPVIKSTIHQIMKDWEDVKLERAADAEMRKHVYTQIEIMERELPNCTPEVRADMEPRIKQLREISDAYFEDVDEKCVAVAVDEPEHLKRARAIVATLEGDEE